MSQFSGRQGHGAKRLRKVEKREEAEARNKRYRDSKELAERFTNEESTREGAVQELVNEGS